MTKNLGAMDRVLRVALAIVVAALYFSGMISGTAALILGILAVIFLLTGLISWCPIYHAVGLNTAAKKE